MGVAVVDSGGANISSVLHALRRLGVEPVFTGDPSVIRAAGRVILPGVGSAGAAMDSLRSSGLADLVPALTQPVLGICLGMQLLFRHSTEGDIPLLGIIGADITRLSGEPGLRIPHMGWNLIETRRNDPLLAGAEADWFYFVHSFAAPEGHWTLASCSHGRPFSAVVRKGNFCGAQFHPERSAAAGARVLKNFLETTCN